MNVPTHTMTVIVTASGSRTKNPARKVRNLLIIGYHLPIPHVVTPPRVIPRAALFGGLIGYRVLRYDGFAGF